MKVNAADKEVYALFNKYKGISEFENMQGVEKILSANKEEENLDDKIKSYMINLKNQKKTNYFII
ncbi:hypothetical protein LCGC14_0871750 [marine sediment metagenome]|uniref:Uncharacterized protein n=1 Tax=marine sediment metagenome TaxID=412755 RepID=A0A0F9P4G7_9ZZZZ